MVWGQYRGGCVIGMGSHRHGGLRGMGASTAYNTLLLYMPRMRNNKTDNIQGALTTASSSPCHVEIGTVPLSLNSMEPTPTPTRMRLSCNSVNVYTIAYRVQYTFTRVHARIPTGQPREDPREEKRACRLRRRTSRRGLSCVSGWWQAELGRLPREDPASIRCVRASEVD